MGEDVESSVRKDADPSLVQMKQSNWQLCPIVGVILVCCIIILILSVCYGISQNRPIRYILVVDCGLKSTELSVFRFQERPFQTNAWIEQFTNYTIYPGLSSFVDEPEKGADFLLGAANDAITKYIPLDKQQETQIFVGAAASVRLLQLQDEAKANALTKTIQYYFQNFAIGTTVNDTAYIRVVPGNEQGWDAWLAANFLSRNFGWMNKGLPNTVNNMLGVLNLEEASSQITFYTPETIQNPEEMYSGKVFGNTYKVYSRSNLCYGVETLRDRYLALVISEADNLMDPIESPCHSGYAAFTVKAEPLFQTPCVSDTENEISGPVITKPAYLPSNVTFRGYFYESKCREFIERLFNNTPFISSQKPTFQGEFYAIHKFYETVRLLNRNANSNKIFGTISSLSSDAWFFCSTYRDPPQSNPDSCLHSWLIIEMLKYYGFSDDTWITFFEGVDGMKASWSTGYALDSSASIPSSVPQIDMNTAGFSVGICLLVLVIIFLTVAFFHLRQRAKS